MVKPKRIEKIVLENFRGATGTTELMLEADKPMVMIFGENGTGKSTILDAIDMVCNKSIGSIGERSSTDAKKHLASLGRQPEDIKVELTYNGETWTGTLSGKNIIVKGSDPLPKAYVLRRSQLLRLVEAAPAERYNELRSFIDVSQIEQCEQALKNAERNANKQLNDAIKAKQLEEDGLKNWWEAEGKPGGSSLEWAKTKSLANPEALHRAVAEAWRLVNLYDAAHLASENYDQASQELQKATESVASIKESSQQVKESKTNIALVRLLQQARDYLATREDDDSCPVCLQPAEGVRIAQELEARIEVMTDSTKLDREVRRAVEEETARRTIIEQRAKDFIVAARSLAHEARGSSLEIVSAFDAELNAEDVASLTADAAPTDEALRVASRVLTTLRGARNELEVSAALNETDLKQLNGIKGHCERIEEADRQVTELYEVHKRLEQAVEILRRERHLFTLGVLEKVKDECCRLYQSIHPDEPLGLSGFRLDEKTKGSLHQDAHFLSTSDVAPQAYFSEAHLDTLGFCLFLSIAKLATNGDAVIVLDDVFTSVDAKHLKRISELLKEESGAFNQIIITTHNRRWFDGLRQNQKLSVSIELSHRWSFEQGIRQHRSKHDIEELNAKLEAVTLDRQGIASLAGVVLESLLDTLTVTYECIMKRTHDGKYTLRSLVDGAKQIAKDLIVKHELRDKGGATTDYKEIPLKPILDDIATTIQTRNQVGAHYNEDGADVLNDDVELLGNCAVRLHAALVCDNCGEMVKKDVETHLRCQCGRKQMVSPKTLRKT